MRSKEAWFYPSAENKHRRGRAMVGSTVRVFLHPPAEFTEGEKQDALEIPLLLQVGDEGDERIVEFGHQVIMCI